MELNLIANKILAIGTIVGQLFILVLIVSLIFFRKKENKLLAFCKQYVLQIGFLVTLAALLASLFYSEIIGFVPCALCWWLRVFMFPQVILFGLALIKRDWGIIDYSLAFSILGAALSVYYYLIEMSSTAVLLCPPNPGAISCPQRLVFEFGYITIPMMSLTAFLIIIVSIANSKIYKQ